MNVPAQAYTKWLGIDPQSVPPNYYQLLGLPLYESEPPAIMDAADTQLSRLQPHQSGPNAAIAQALAAQIEAVRDCLLRPDSRRQYDQQLQVALAGQLPMSTVTGPPGAAAAPPAAPPAGLPPAAAPTATHAPAAPVAAASSVPVAQVAAAPVQAVAMPAQAMPIQAVPGQAMPVQAMPVQAVPAQAMPVGMAPGPAVAVPAAAIPAATPVMATAAPSIEVPTISTSAVKSARFAMQQRQQRNKALTAFGLIAAAAVVLLLAGGYALREQLGLVSPASSRASGTTVAEGRPSVTIVDPSDVRPIYETPQRTGSTSTIPPSELVSPDRRAMESAMGDATSMPDAPDPNTPPEPAMPDASATSTAPVTLPETKASDREMSELRRLLAAGRAALANRDLTRAAEQFDLATLSATATDSATQAATGREALQAVQNFWQAVVDGAKSLAGKELTVEGRTFAIIEADETKVVVRSEGREVTQPIARIPLPVALALAEQSLPTGDPSGNLATGCVLLLEERADKARGRQLLQEAGEAGTRILELYGR